jgi:hypothetical protein
MFIKSLFVAIALAVIAMLPVAATTAAQDSVCGDISDYIDMVDTQVGAEMHALVTQPGWAEDAQFAAEALNASDGDLDNVSVEVIQPLLEYIAVPGTVLDGFDLKDVPDAALPLHESARDYWLATGDMFDAMMNEGPGAIFPFLETIETYTTENLAAQEEILELCPELPESYADAQARLSELFEVVDGEGDPATLAEATLEDMDGMGYFYLFFGEEEVSAREPAQVSTPVIAPVSTPGS